MHEERKMSFPESLPQNRDVIRWNVPPVVIYDLHNSRCYKLESMAVSASIDSIFYGE